MARAGLILDRYRPLGTVGAGGFGTVQVAWDQRIQRKVAIKTIQLTELDAARAALPGAEAVAGSGDASPEAERWQGVLPWEDAPAGQGAASGEGEGVGAGEGAGDGAPAKPEPVHALANIPGLDEARTAAMLADPRIVTVFDFEVRGQTAYLIMEYVEGLTLTRLLREYGDYLTLDIVACVFESVAGALQVAHKAGVLHLDIKPDNILIDETGQVKVTDFGLATLADAQGLGTTGGGTVGYMPLEQMRRQNLDARTDEWSLACVLYEMLSGENPFAAPNLEQAPAAIEEAELVLPSLCWDALDPEMDDVVFYALDPDMDERYASVADFADEASKFLGDAKRGRTQLATIVKHSLREDQLAAAARERERQEGAQEPETPAARRAARKVERAEGERAGERAERLRAAIFGRAQDEGAQDARGQARRARAPRRTWGERVAPGFANVAAWAFAAAGAFLVALLATSNMPFITGTKVSFMPVAVLAALVVGVVGAVFPAVGALAAFELLGVALILANAPLPGAIMLVAAALWWYFVARGGKASANVALSVPVAGSVGGNAFAPLAAGACLMPLQAALTALFAAFVAVVLGAFGSANLIGWDAFANWGFADAGVQERLVRMLHYPAVWCMAASWVASAWAQAFISTRGGARMDIVALVAGVALVVAGFVGAYAASPALFTGVHIVQVLFGTVLSAAAVFCALRVRAGWQEQ